MKFFAALKHGTLLVLGSLLLGFFGVFFILGLSGGVVLWHFNNQLPDYQTVLNGNDVASSKIYSRDGTLLYEFSNGEVKRTPVELNQISDYLKDATIAVEDKDFYNHGPVSITGIIRAAMANYKTGSVNQGGSTITQQFVKNAVLSSDRSYTRKISEALLSYKLERHLTKTQILSYYLNGIPYGRNAYGAEAASKAYFDKSARELTLAESAYLAALPQRPSYLSPTGPNIEALESRKNLVLQRMLEQKYITTAEYDEAKNAEVTFKDVHTTIVAPYFVTYVQNYLTQKYGEKFLREGGLKVYTTLDLRLQGIAEKAVADGVAVNSKKNNAHNAALVAIEPSSGKILAMVGGKDYFGTPEPKGCTPGVNCYFDPHLNVSAALRQPGSSFKPFVYATAFSKQYGYNPLSTVSDSPVSFGVPGGRAYSPKNYDGSYHGNVTMRMALAGSLNVPAVKVLNAVGVDAAVQTAHSLGITSPLANCGLSLVLGGCEVRLVDHVAAYASLANGGKANYATPFLRIEDKDGSVLEEYKPDNHQAIDPEAVYELISIMTDNDARAYIFGKNSPLILSDRLVAAKTGTTNSWKDGWTLGFTKELAAGVWTGNDDGTLMRQGADGVFTAAPIWHQFMEEALKDTPPSQFDVPPGILQIAYNVYTNRPAGKNDKKTRMESFAYYALPKDLKQLAAPRGSQIKLTPETAKDSVASVGVSKNQAVINNSSSTNSGGSTNVVETSNSPTSPVSQAPLPAPEPIIARVPPAVIASITDP